MSGIGEARRAGRAILRIGAGAFVCALSFASVAYACVPVPFVFVRTVGTAMPGDKATVAVNRMGGGTTELRWNALDGPLLATGQGPDFVTEVTLPAAPPGVYVLVALVRGQDGSVGSVVSAPVQVAAASGAVGQGGQAANGAPGKRSSSGVSTGVVVGLVVLGLIVIVSVPASRRRRARRNVAAEDPVPVGIAGRA